MTHKALVLTTPEYNRTELFGTMRVLKSRGFDFELTSSRKIIKDEDSETYHSVERLITDISLEEALQADCFIVTSGAPDQCKPFWTHKYVQRIVKGFFEQNKPLGGICMAAPTVASVSEGKKVSTFPIIEARQFFTDRGAIVQTLTLSIDPPLVTCENQWGTDMWVTSICDLVEGKEPQVRLVDSGFNPIGRPRKPIKVIEDIKRKQNGSS